MGNERRTQWKKWRWDDEKRPSHRLNLKLLNHRLCTKLCIYRAISYISLSIHVGTSFKEELHNFNMAPFRGTRKRRAAQLHHKRASRNIQKCEDALKLVRERVEYLLQCNIIHGWSEEGGEGGVSTSLFRFILQYAREWEGFNFHSLVSSRFEKKLNNP